MDIFIWQTARKGRTYIQIHATPQSPGTRTLLQQFKQGVRALERKWKATAAAAKKRRRRSGSGRRARPR